jgi:hypothetical protein
MDNPEGRPPPILDLTEDQDNRPNFVQPVLDLTEDVSQPALQQNPAPSLDRAELKKQFIDLLANVSKEDGNPSPSKGPCGCGHKHWLEGKEYDFVFRLPTSRGLIFLGYNMNDNPYTVAAEFISKHRLNEGTLDDTRLISAIAGEILDSTQQAQEQATPVQSTPLPASRPWNPYEATTGSAVGSHSRYDSTTGRWESVIPGSELKRLASSSGGTGGKPEDKEKHRLVAEEKKKLQTMKAKQAAEKERIRQQMKIARLEREEKIREEKRREEERKKQIKAQMTDGNLSWQVTTQSPQLPPATSSLSAPDILPSSSGHTADSPSFIPTPEWYEHKERDEDENGSEDEDEYEDTQDFQRLLEEGRAAWSAKAGAKKGRVQTLESLRKTEPEEPSVPTKKEEWTLPMMKHQYMQLEEAMFVGALDNAGFAPSEIQRDISLLRLLATHGAAPQPLRQSKKVENERMAGASEPPQSPTWFAGSGQSLRSSAPPPTAEKTGEVLGQEPGQPSGVPAQRVVVDNSKPTTTVAVKLSNGQRLVIKCNMTHTIAELRGHIDCEYPISQRYQLMLVYPRKILSDETVSVERAGLLNASIVQSLV